ncbi:MAG: anti-sigma B factor antagonist [Lysobacterales bacterium CG02_land_8_20_14_3_00_62_12]|nr:MAG: anti-sigma B factor antagonist [Xanthomonadales bacterium CG02_land_8_20_14_3_00_62_12]
MPAASKRDGNALWLSGVLDAASVTALHAERWKLRGVEQIHLEQVSAVDSTGVALIADLVARAAKTGPRPQVHGLPTGLTELCSAYRIAPDFSDFP